MVRKHSEFEDDKPRKRVRVDQSQPDDPSQNFGEDNAQESESDYEADEAEERALREAAAQMAKRAPKVGAVRQAGAIERLEVFKFMCHDYLVIEFGPQANFIIGHNGSGKSAILTAVILALGGKASTTNRASSLKGFIKHESPRAEIKLTLSNRGEDAFRPDSYGDSIIIERAINREGGSQYKLKSGRDKKIVSVKKEELQSMLDHFMIQADNPLNVLSQDNAKLFLSASSSKDKYGLFIRGTQLQQLTDEYEEIQANITTAKMNLDRKTADLSTILERAKQAKQTLNILEQATEHETKIAVLQKELAWAYVMEAQEEQEKLAVKVQGEEEIIPQCESEIKQAEAEIPELKAQMAALTAKMAQSNDEELDARCEELRRLLKDRSKDIKTINNEMREQDTITKKLRVQIEDQKRLIDAENAKASRSNDMTRQDAINRREECEKDIKEKETRLAVLPNEIGNLKGQMQSLKSRVIEFTNDIDRVQKDINATQENLRRAQGAQHNRISAFGHWAEPVSRDIDVSRWKTKPLGPLGAYLQCKDKKWSKAIDSILGHTLTAYLVDDIDDEDQLRKILQKNSCRSSIIRSSYDMFDYTSGEPDQEYMTILRMLSFDNEYVKRALINSAKIEKTILVEHRREGDPIMSLPPAARRNVALCYTHDGFKVGGAGSGKMVEAITWRDGASRLSNDHTAYIAEQTEELRRQQLSKEQIVADRHQVSQEINDIVRQSRKLEAEQNSLKDVIRKRKTAKNKLDDEIAESTSSNLAALEAVKADLEAEVESAASQFQELLRRLNGIKHDLRPVLEEKERIDAHFATKQDEEKVVQEALIKASQAESDSKTRLQHWKTTLDKHQGLLNTMKREFQAACDNVALVTSQATQFCGSDEIIESNKSSKKLIAEVDKHTKALKSTEARFGKSLDDIRAECQDATVAWQKATTEFRELGNSIRILKHALALRKTKWHQFRAHISVRAKMKFINHLSNRGYTGKLNFDHLHQRLDVQVDTNSDEVNQAKMRDPKGLSGGERSFSTISLLLTLWDAVNCPIRCLDEFDVFMDVPHRKVAVRMMIDSAKEANEVQYIFITPQDMSSISFGPETRISRMDDPERKSGALGAGAR